MGNEEEKESLQNEKKMEMQAAWKKRGYDIPNEDRSRRRLEKIE